MMRQKCIDIIQDRIDGVYNDLKAFIYIRKHRLQHQGTPDNIGGGNIVVGLSLFSALSFLGKCYYCCKRPEKFEEVGNIKNEKEVFIDFIKYVQESGIELGLPHDGETLGLVWHGFRDWLSHRLTVEPGKTLVTFVFDIELKGSVLEILDKTKADTTFRDDGHSRNWEVNCDTLLAYLPDITIKVKDYITECAIINVELLAKVVGIS